MPKFRERSVVIEAIQFTPKNIERIKQQWPEVHIAYYQLTRPPCVAHICVCATIGDVKQIKPGYWIIRGAQGEMYLCEPDIFKLTYYQVAE